jgi:hypothetical protein
LYLKQENLKKVLRTIVIGWSNSKTDNVLEKQLNKLILDHPSRSYYCMKKASQCMDNACKCDTHPTWQSRNKQHKQDQLTLIKNI